MAEFAAQLCGVTHRYGERVALDNLSVDLRRGEVVALLGPNGAGKTTAVKVLLGLLRPQAGTAAIFGRNPQDGAARTRIGAMLQVARVPETVRVREYLQLFRAYYPKPMDFDEIVTRAGIAGLENRLMGALSGGQRQRVLFGLALAGNPDLVFLDEPTVSMDIEARQAVWAEVRRLRGEGRTVLLTTHYLEEADALADRVVMIRAGRVVAEGTPAEVKGSVGGRRIRCVTKICLDDLRSLATVTDVSREDGVTLMRAGNAEAVVRTLLARDEELRGLEISSPALEEAFLALTGDKAEVR